MSPLVLAAAPHDNGACCRLLLSLQYALESQVRLHGFDPKDALIEVAPRDGELCLRQEDIDAAIAAAGPQLALVMFSGVQYFTGQAFDVRALRCTALRCAVAPRLRCPCARRRVGHCTVVLDVRACELYYVVWVCDCVRVNRNIRFLASRGQHTTWVRWPASTSPTPLATWCSRCAHTRAHTLTPHVHTHAHTHTTSTHVQHRGTATACVQPWRRDAQLHDWDVDFAAWCSYKYLNSGPGGIGGAFVHEKHDGSARPRLQGWWGARKTDRCDEPRGRCEPTSPPLPFPVTCVRWCVRLCVCVCVCVSVCLCVRHATLLCRFDMGHDFHSSPGAFGFQLSNPPVLTLAALYASLQVFDRTSMDVMRAKSLALTG